MLRNHIIVHLPHAANVIPLRGFGSRYIIDPREEANLVTDWFTDELFDGHEAVRFDLSRVYCDVERLIPDPLDERGQGFAYEQTLDGRALRHINDHDREHIRAFYDRHHHRLAQAVEEAVSLYPVLIIDAHSFSAEQARLSGYDGDPMNLPQICLGYDSGRLPEDFIKGLSQQFKAAGLSVALNTPYSGSLMPQRFAEHPDVRSVMIEVNKGLYLEPDSTTKNDRFDEVRDVVQHAIAFAASYDFRGA